MAQRKFVILISDFILTDHLMSHERHWMTVIVSVGAVMTVSCSCGQSASCLDFRQLVVVGLDPKPSCSSHDNSVQTVDYFNSYSLPNAVTVSYRVVAGSSCFCRRRSGTAHSDLHRFATSSWYSINDQRNSY